MDALNSVGQVYRNFRITKYLPLEELHSTLIELIHEPSGARVMHISNDDLENLFCLSFQTLPDSSNGVAHILEHTVLCGSKKYPVKDPFFSMKRRSLNTFMNALTGSDFTCYPASSQVEKDFYNLLEVYLDAVFHPLLKKESFLQEGHRLEFAEPSDPTTPLQIKGIVYNEMKGAMNTADARLSEVISSNLMPDLTYSHNSGGDPKDIPSLTYEQLVEFHRAFYHPSRCLFFFYGNMPLAKHLDFIESHTLRHASKLPPLPPLPPQTRFTAPRRIVGHYPIQKDEPTRGKAKISFSWLTCPISHQSEVLALCLADSYLSDTDASPLKKAMLKSGLCKEVDATLDIEISEIPFTIAFSGCDEEKEEKLKKTFFSAIESICSKPLDTEIIEASLHHLEFHRAEITSEGGPYGLHLFMRAGLIKQHGSEAEEALLIHKLFAELRDRLKDPGYLPGLIRKHTIDNPHLVTVVLLPDPELEQKEEGAIVEKLEKIRAAMSEKESKKLVQQAEELKNFQEASEKQSVECLPKVTLRDISPEPVNFPLQHTTMDNFDVYHSDCFTNQIIYADLVFDLPHIEAADLPLVSLLTHIWTELGAGGKTYEESLHAMQAHTGGIGARITSYVSNANPDVLRPALALHGKALARKAKPFFDLLIDYAKGPDFTDHERVQEWLSQHASELERRLSKSAFRYASQLSLRGYSTASYLDDQWFGLSYYKTVLKLAKSPLDTWIGRLPELAKQMVSTGKPHLVLSCAQEEAEMLRKQEYYRLSNWKPAKEAPPWRGDYPLIKTESHAYPISSPVAFTALGMRTSAYSSPDVAELMISTHLLEHVSLHKAIREKGGAYGGGAAYTPSTGNYYLYAYRDPHLAKTVENFQHAIDAIAAGQFSDRELEEAKIELIAEMDSPLSPGERAVVAYAWARAGRTYQDRQKLRKQILGATKEGIAAALQRRLVGIPSTLITFLGSELYKKESSKIKLPLRSIND